MACEIGLCEVNWRDIHTSSSLPEFSLRETQCLAVLQNQTTDRSRKAEKKLTKHRNIFGYPPEVSWRDTSGWEVLGWLERMHRPRVAHGKIRPQSNLCLCSSLSIHSTQNELESGMLKHFQFIGIMAADEEGHVIRGDNAFECLCLCICLEWVFSSIKSCTAPCKWICSRVIEIFRFSY